MKTVNEVADYIRANKDGIVVDVQHGTSDFTVELGMRETDEGDFKYALTINDECIVVYINMDKRVLYLASYYYNKSITNCVPKGKKDIPLHKDIFSFLKQLARLLEFSGVTLTDGSTKTFDPCKVNYYIFSWAGKPTFYEQFGFHNADYTKFIEKTRKKTIKSLLKKEFDYKLLEPPLTEKSKMKDVAEFIYTNCKTPSSHTASANEILKAINACNPVKDYTFKASEERGGRSRKRTSKFRNLTRKF